MSQYATPELVPNGAGSEERTAHDRAGSRPAVATMPILVGGLALGLIGDAVLRAPGEPGLNVFVWVAAIAVAAVVLYQRAGIALHRGRVAWLAIAVLFAAGLAWRDSSTLKLLALWCVTMAFALAAYRTAADWILRTDVFRYLRAWATGALHAWVAAPLAVVEAIRSPARTGQGRTAGWNRATAMVRGLVIAIPLLVVFGALFMSADAVFADLVRNVLRIDFDLIASHVLLFGVTAWLATGYLRGFMTGTELPSLRDLSHDNALAALASRRPTLSITEVATVLAALNLLFLAFVIVQFRYLFGGDALVQVTPDLTYADYARRGFFELVAAVALVVPVLLAADWLLARERQRDDTVFRGLAAVQIGLVGIVTASAFQRLRLYHATFGLTESRFFAMVLLFWIGAILLWLSATVLRGRRDFFAFGTLASGLATIGLLFVANPDAIIARTNLARLQSADSAVRFDVAYATTLSGDAIPVLIEALPTLPRDVQCRLAEHMLASLAADRERSVRTWNWSASRARTAVRANESLMRSMAGSDQACTNSTPVPGSH